MCLFVSQVFVSSETGIAKALQDLENGMSVVVKTDVSDEWANIICRLSEQTRGQTYHCLAAQRAI